MYITPFPSLPHDSVKSLVATIFFFPRFEEGERNRALHPGLHYCTAGTYSVGKHEVVLEEGVGGL